MGPYSADMKRCLVLLSLVLTGCATAPDRSAATLSGTVTTDTPLTLPASAKLTLLLVDAAAAGPAARPIAEETKPSGDSFPISFGLPYEASLITPEGDYRLIAQITIYDAVWYSNILGPKRVLASGSAREGIEVPVRKDGVLR